MGEGALLFQRGFEKGDSCRVASPAVGNLPQLHAPFTLRLLALQLLCPLKGLVIGGGVRKDKLLALGQWHLAMGQQVHHTGSQQTQRSRSLLLTFSRDSLILSLYRSCTPDNSRLEERPSCSATRSSASRPAWRPVATRWEVMDGGDCVQQLHAEV